MRVSINPALVKTVHTLVTELKELSKKECYSVESILGRGGLSAIVNEIIDYNLFALLLENNLTFDYNKLITREIPEDATAQELEELKSQPSIDDMIKNKWLFIEGNSFIFSDLPEYVKLAKYQGFDATISYNVYCATLDTLGKVFNTDGNVKRN